MHLRAFTLIELLVVIAIIAILSVVVILTLNPAELLKQSRDANRVSDMATVNTALGIFSEDQTGSLGNASTTYLSIPDPLATSTLGDQCQGLTLPSLPNGALYHCAASSTYRNVDGTGWIPINLNAISSHAPLGSLPIDPVNTTSSGFYYSYTPQGTQYEIASVLESQKDIPMMAQDGGSYDGLYQVGTKLDLTPPFRSYGLVGYWPLDEGSGTTALDASGSGNAGSWNGSQTGTSGYYSAGKVGAWGGTFDGSTDHVVNAAATINYSATFSIAAWFETATTTGGIAGGHSHNFMRLDASKLEGDTDFSSGSWTLYKVTGHTTVSNGTWHYGVFVVNGLNLSIYVDGGLDNSSTQPDTNFAGSGTGFYIGQLGNATQYFNGLVDDVRIYSRALSAAEIMAIYNAEK